MTKIVTSHEQKMWILVCRDGVTVQKWRHNNHAR